MAALRACLADEAGAPAEWPLVPEHLQEAFVEFVVCQRVTWVIARCSGQLGLSAASAELLRDAAAADVQAAMRVQAVAAQVVGGLNGAGIRCLTYKGVALALATTGDPSARGASDVDLIMDPSDVPAAHDFLMDGGAEFVRGYCPSPADELWDLARRVGCEAPYRWRGVDIDLHWRFDRLPQIAAIPFDDLWEARTHASIAGLDLPTMGSVDALLLTCAHGTKEHWRHLRWVVDLVRQARDVHDWRQVLERSRETGCEESLAVGLAMAAHLAGGVSPLVPGPRPTRLADWAWADLMGDSAPFGRVAIGAQSERLRWSWQTLPSRRAGGSMLARQALTTLDMAELPLPRSMAWAYPLVRPALWARRLATGRYGAAALRDYILVGGCTSPPLRMRAVGWGLAPSASVSGVTSGALQSFVSSAMWGRYLPPLLEARVGRRTRVRPVTREGR